ncbi:MAG: formimidoylglutamase [Bdellovibrio sp.]
MNWLHPIDKHLLFTRHDKEDPRLGECVQILPKGDLTQLSQHTYDIALLGYPDDEGIAMNGGRPGAQAAPREIRASLYKMTPHLQHPQLPHLLDLGDLADKEKSLGERHEKGREIVRALNQNGKPWISLGGGHDYGYADTAGFLDAFKGEAVVVNFDAHMDVRPSENGFHSGTPFHRILSQFKGQLDFAEVGIQNQCNSHKHIQWAQQQGAHVFTLDQILTEGLLKSLQKFLAGKESKKVFLSVDMDAFTSTEAPGCSQSWTTGLRSQEFLEALRWLVARHDVRGLGLYEVSPPLDFDNHTSKLAALIAHQFIFSTLQKASTP